mgnify:CR=1 FL=1
MAVITLRSVRMKENAATDNVQILVSAEVRIYETKTRALAADFIHDRTGLNTSLARETANVAADIPVILKQLGLKSK